MNHEQSSGPTINIDSITGGVNNIGGTVENQTINYGDSPPPASLGGVYDVIAKAVAADHTAVNAARRLLELEAREVHANRAGPRAVSDEQVDAQAQPDVIEQQSLLARYRPQIVAALKEMGLVWLQTAFPHVAFVRPLIQMAIDAWKENRA